jgi:hypothetical protein
MPKIPGAMLHMPGMPKAMPAYSAWPYEQVQRAKAAHLAMLRERGESRDPFEEAAAAEVGASTRSLFSST